MNTDIRTFFETAAGRIVSTAASTSGASERGRTSSPSRPSMMRDTSRRSLMIWIWVPVLRSMAVSARSTLAKSRGAARSQRTQPAIAPTGVRSS
jgi:hypothetical protein